MVDGSGLTLLPDGNGTHVVTPEDHNMWLGGPPAGDSNPEVYFNLGEVHPIEYMMFWNYNGPAAGGIGVQEADIYYSTDTDPLTATWTLVVNDQVFTAGPAADDVPFGQQVALNISAQLIRLDINKGLVDQAFPGAFGWTGISEVRFFDPNFIVPECVDQPLSDLDNNCWVDMADYSKLTGNWNFIAPTLTDDFTGTVIDSSKWNTVTLEGTLTQNDELIFSNATASSAWDRNYIFSKSSFLRRAPTGEVLCLTIDTQISPNAAFILGFYPGETYTSWVDAVAGVDFGFHGNRLDLALWFMENPDLTHMLRIEEDGQAFLPVKLRLEMGPDNGALWQYDIGNGWRVGRDTRQLGTGDGGDSYGFFISSFLYDNDSFVVDNVSIVYKTPTNRAPVDEPAWGLPVNEAFAGSMDPRWINWAGTPAVPNPPSTPDFATSPGWAVFDGPAGGFGLFLRHLPFLPENILPFFAETHLRFPIVDPPECNYEVGLGMLIENDFDLITEDHVFPIIEIQNFPGASQTMVRARSLRGLPSLASGDTLASQYWNSGDLYLRLGIEANRLLSFAYKFAQNDPWTVFHTYDPATDGENLFVPFGCDLIGNAAAGGCQADQTSYEIDYVNFYSGATPYTTLPFTDDFEDGVLDDEKWEVDGGTVTESNGRAVIQVGPFANAWGVGTFSTFDAMAWDRFDPNNPDNPSEGGKVLRLTYDVSASQGVHFVGGFARPGGKDIYDVVHGMSRLASQNIVYVWNGTTFSPGVSGPVALKARITLGSERGALYEYDFFNLGWTTFFDNRNISGDDGDKYQVLFDNGGTSGSGELYINDVIIEYVEP